MGILSGKVAVITGSTRGLGLGIAEAYAREGATVVISSATDGKTGLLVRAFGPWQLIRGMLREGWRRLTRQYSDSVELTITPVASGD